MLRLEGGLTLDVRLPPGCAYPAQPPALALRRAAPPPEAATQPGPPGRPCLRGRRVRTRQGVPGPHGRGQPQPARGRPAAPRRPASAAPPGHLEQTGRVCCGGGSLSPADSVKKCLCGQARERAGGGAARGHARAGRGGAPAGGRAARARPGRRRARAAGRRHERRPGCAAAAGRARHVRGAARGQAGVPGRRWRSGLHTGRGGCRRRAARAWGPRPRGRRAWAAAWAIARAGRCGEPALAGAAPPPAQVLRDLPPEVWHVMSSMASAAPAISACWPGGALLAG